MKASINTTILSEAGYIDISVKLRNELELTIGKLFEQNGFNRCFENQLSCVEDAAKSDFLYLYLINSAPKDYVLSGKLLQGIKIWFNMNDADRLCVIDKFITCYRNVPPSENKKKIIRKKLLFSASF